MLLPLLSLVATALAAGPACPGSANTQVSVRGKNFNIRCATDYFGGDISVLRRVVDLQRCINLCAANAECKAIAYDPSAQKCWLKNPVNSGRNVPGITGAILEEVEAQLTCVGGRDNGRIYTSSNGGQYQITCAMDSVGNDIRSQPATKLEDCIAFCDQTTGCVAAAFRNGRCWAKRSVNDLTVRSGAAFAKLLPAVTTTTTTTATTTTSTTTAETTTTTSEATTEPTTSPTTTATTTDPITTSFSSFTQGATSCSPTFSAPPLRLPSPTPIFTLSEGTADDTYFTVDLPAGVQLSIYNQSANRIYVGSNGYVSIESGSTTYPYSYDTPDILPIGRIPNLLVAPLYVDLYYVKDAGVWYSVVDNILYIEWRTITYIGRNENPLQWTSFHMQQDLTQPNKFIFEYFNVCQIKAPAVGVQINSTSGYMLDLPLYLPQSGWRVGCDTTTAPGFCQRTR